MPPTTAILSKQDDMQVRANVLRIGEMLLRLGRLEQRDLDKALAAQASLGGPLGDVLQRLGLVSERDLVQALSLQLDIPVVGPEDFPAEAVTAEGLDPAYLIRHGVLPLASDGERWLQVAMASPEDGFLRKALALATGLEIRPAVAIASELQEGLERLYLASANEEATLDSAPPDGALQDTDFVEHLKDLASEAPVISLVNRIIARVVDLRASDIHIEMFEDGLHVRYRVDGVMQAAETESGSLAAAVISRIKLLAHLNIAERRLPQDGRLRSRVKGHELDLRISTLPTIHGESVVIRVLDQASIALELERMGFAPDTLMRFSELIAQPHGIVLVTGPTGSGKTTTLYACLARFDAGATKIVTVEDPVEYQLAGINQLQVHPAIGLTFASALRAILRQDPDTIMIGEMRDTETARIAVQSALTGHLVLSTLHTNTAASAITRLQDMGIERYLITSTVTGVLAQRLVRRLCDHCKQAEPMTPQLLAASGLSHAAERLAGKRIHSPRGCEHCKQTGYRGRVAIHELLVLDGSIRDAVVAGADATQLHAIARESGMRSLHEDALHKMLNGETSLDEVLRVTRSDEDA